MPIFLIILLLIALSFPRIAIFLIWILSSWFSGAGVDPVSGILAFIFMPYSLLWYSAVMNWYGGIWGFWQVAFLIVAILIDVSSLLGSIRYYGDYRYEN